MQSLGANPLDLTDGALACSISNMQWTSNLHSNTTALSHLLVEHADFAAQDDAFIDSISGMLQCLANECVAAIEWSSESEAAISGAADAFKRIVSICRDAGIAVETDNDDDELRATVDTDSNAVYEHPLSDSTQAAAASRPPSPVCILRCESVSMASSVCASHISSAVLSSSQVSSPARSQAKQQHLRNHYDSGSCVLSDSLLQRDEIIEIELTDLLAHTHEEIQQCRQELSDRLDQSDARHSQAQTHTRGAMQSLQTALERSHDTIARLEADALATKQSVAALQIALSQSHQSIEAAIKAQSRQWKAVCSDLVVEKRNVAKQLAEERGRSAALRDHLALHSDNQSHTREHRSPSPCSRHGTLEQMPTSPTRSETELESAANSPAQRHKHPSSHSSLVHWKRASAQSDREDKRISGSSTNVSIRSASCVTDSEREQDRESSCASERASHRRLRTSDLMAAHTHSSSRVHSRSTASSASGVEDTDASQLKSVKMQQVKREPSALSAPSFRRYYLSSTHQIPTLRTSSGSRRSHKHSAAGEDDRET